MRDDPRGETRRLCYSLTTPGRRALTRWLTDDSELPVFETRNEPLLRLRFAAAVDPAQRVAIVRCMRELHERRIATLEAILRADDFDDEFDRMATEYQLGINRWARDWTVEAEQRVVTAS